LLVGVEPDPANAPADGGKTPAVGDPVCVGWEDRCVVYRLSAADGAWVTHKGPAAAALPRKVIPAVGPHAAAAVSSDDGYGGWLFDLDTARWSTVPKSPVAAPRGLLDPIAFAFVGRHLIVWGAIGSDPEGAVLDTTTMKWRPMAQAPVTPRFRSLAAAVNDKLVVWGGYGLQGPRGQRGPIGPLADGAVYDVPTDTWVKMPPAPVADFPYGSSCVVWRGRFVVVGGRIGRTFVRSPMVYDPATRKWDTLPPLPMELAVNGTAAALADRLFMWSGSSSANDAATPNGAVFDFWTRQWKPLAEAPVDPRSLAFAKAAGSAVTVWGGWSQGRRRVNFHRDGATYDIDKGTWTQILDLPADVPYEMHPGW
jgi:hypothetical protein